eukprot:scaffold124809_cov24-Phaeocystis_antarctica.AAC.1
MLGWKSLTLTLTPTLTLTLTLGVLNRQSRQAWPEEAREPSWGAAKAGTLSMLTCGCSHRMK